MVNDPSRVKAFWGLCYHNPMSDNHIIGSGLTDQQLTLASWWTRHGMNLRRLGTGTLIGVSVLFWGFTLWTALDVYVISYPRESRIMQVIATNGMPAETLAAIAPRSLQTSPSLALASTGNRTDLLTQISNPNAQWWAEFTYQFMLGASSTEPRAGYILPSSQRYLTELGVTSPIIGSATVKIDNIEWHRINPDDVERDYPAFAEKRLQFVFEDINYQNDLRLNNQAIGQTTFTLRNLSAYGYWSVDLPIVLYRADTPIAITSLNVQNVLPGEARPLSIHWVENMSGISKTDIHANVNILDPKNFLSSRQF